VKGERAAVTICSTAFATLGRDQAQALGCPDLPIAVIAHPFGLLTRDEIRGVADKCADDIARLVSESHDATERPVAREAIANPRDIPGSHGCVLAPPGRLRAQSRTGGDRRPVEAPDVVEAPDDLDLINRLYRERRWGDGLPVVPPTVDRVERMLRHVRRARGDVVARVAPGFGAATVERIAINAVLAGCEPEYLPAVIAAVEAVAAPQFNLQAIQATTNPVAPWIIVNGSLARELDVNATFNCLGQGTWANATIGRALRLILQNIGGARPGDMDRATHGQPGKYTFCCAENEEANPWEPLHVERGYAREASTVTVVGAEGTMNMNTHTKDAAELVRVFAETMMHPPSNEYTHGGEPWLVLSPEHAEILARAGLGKAEVKRRLWEGSRMPAVRMTGKDLLRVRDSRTAELGEIGPDTLLPICAHPEDIGLIVAGGPGTHSVYVPCFGNSRAVTREVASG
jgi:hypothetical protein